MENVAHELDQILAEAHPRLRTITDEIAGTPRGTGKWSRKQVLGHLIDSAANNHPRFVRLQQGEISLPGYAQEHWVGSQRYQDRPWSSLVDLWFAYNSHLAHVVRHIDPASLGNVWHAPDQDLTLEFIATDYPRHMRHHLDQVLG